MDTPDLDTTIAQAVDLSDEIDALEEKIEARRAKLRPLEEAIVAAAIEVATDDNGTLRAQIGAVKIVWPKPSLKLTAENFDAVQKLAGKGFAKIAEKIAVPFRLLKDARAIIPALFGKDGPKFLKLLESAPAAPRITYS